MTRKRFLLSICFVLFATTTLLAQTRYYLEIDRPNCCRLTVAEWQDIAAKMNARKMPAFFGTHEVLDYGVRPLPARFTKTVAREGLLIVGPFATNRDMWRAVEMLPAFLPKGYDTSTRIEPGPTGDAQTWQIGMYQITAYQSTEAVGVKPTRQQQGGRLDGVVVETWSAASSYGVVILSGGVRYWIQLGGNSGHVDQIIGNVDTVGKKVKVTFTDKRPLDDGAIVLEATRVEEMGSIRPRN